MVIFHEATHVGPGHGRSPGPVQTRLPPQYRLYVRNAPPGSRVYLLGIEWRIEWGHIPGLVNIQKAMENDP